MLKKVGQTDMAGFFFDYAENFSIALYICIIICFVEVIEPRLHKVIDHHKLVWQTKHIQIAYPFITDLCIYFITIKKQKKIAMILSELIFF